MMFCFKCCFFTFQILVSDHDDSVILNTTEADLITDAGTSKVTMKVQHEQRRERRHRQPEEKRSRHSKRKSPSSTGRIKKRPLESPERSPVKPEPKALPSNRRSPSPVPNQTAASDITVKVTASFSQVNFKNGDIEHGDTQSSLFFCREKSTFERRYSFYADLKVRAERTLAHTPLCKNLRSRKTPFRFIDFQVAYEVPGAFGQVTTYCPQEISPASMDHNTAPALFSDPDSPTSGIPMTKFYATFILEVDGPPQPDCHQSPRPVPSPERIVIKEELVSASDHEDEPMTPVADPAAAAEFVHRRFTPKPKLKTNQQAISVAIRTLREIADLHTAETPMFTTQDRLASMLSVYIRMSKEPDLRARLPPRDAAPDAERSRTQAPGPRGSLWQGRLGR